MRKDEKSYHMQVCSLAVFDVNVNANMWVLNFGCFGIEIRALIIGYTEMLINISNHRYTEVLNHYFAK
jgi:hypothetical protein